MQLSLTDLEQAINFWRARRPSTGEEHALSKEVATLATVYALMIYEGENMWPLERIDAATLHLIEAWREQREA